MRVAWCAARGIARSLVAGIVCVVLMSNIGTSLSAQRPRDSNVAPVSHMHGRVVKPGGDSVMTVPHVWVTLHRVARDTAGPIDSVRTSADGRFAFTYHPTGESDAVYFASSSYCGIAYFTLPVRGESENSDSAEITVFDTTSRAVPISIRGHHIIVGQPDAKGVRTITEVVEFSNDSSVTRVAVGTELAGASWSAILPARAQHAAVVAGDVPPRAAQFENGHIALFAPIAPGLKQVVYTYRLDGDAFPVTMPVEHPTSVLEVLVEEPGATVEHARLREVKPVTIDGRRFRRFLGQDVPGAAAFTVTVPDRMGVAQQQYVIVLTVLIVGAMIGALAYALRRR